MDKAGVAVRFFAVFIDGLVMTALAFMLVFVFGLFAGGASQTDSGALQTMAGIFGTIIYIILILFQFLYYGYFWSKDGQSPGKKLLGVMVVQKDGRSMSFVKAGLRGTLGYWISGLIFGLGFIWAIFDADNETWHDMIFGTRVIRG